MLKLKKVGMTPSVLGKRTIMLGLALLMLSGQIAPAQELPQATVIANEDQSPAQQDSLYFADITVRGRPIFQVGSLPEISANQRAEIINRRIGSLLTRAETLRSVTVQITGRDLATLQLNKRVLMTVTQQDAEDYGVSVMELAQDWANQLNQAIDKPPLAMDVAQRLESTVQQLGRNMVDKLPALIGALLVMSVTWGAARSMRYIAFHWAQQTEGDRSTEVLVGRLGYGGVWIVGSVIALGVLGLDFGALLGALGLTSVAIGFSLKDVLSNYISGVILLAARPFRLGDQVVIKAYEGTIIQIDLRATTLKTYDGRMVYIPNQEVFGASITNNTASTTRRSSVIVGIDYDAHITEAIETILQAIQQIDLVEPSPAPEVLVRELAASTVNLEVRFWVNSKRIEFLAMTSQVTVAIKEALQAASIEMPTDIYIITFRDANLNLTHPQQHP